MSIAEPAHNVVALTPDEFQAWWSGAWEQGQHVLVLGQTGSGKTVLEIFLCRPRKFVIALDAKGGDSSLSKSGWTRVTKWPLPLSLRERLKNGEPVRVIVGKVARTAKDMADNQALLARVVHDLWTQGRWTVVCDEGQLLADKRFAGGAVGDDLEQMLIAARDRKISVMFTAQRPQIGRSTPAAMAAITQSTYVAVSRTRDRRVHQRIAEITGRPLPETEALINALPRFCWALFGLDPYEPVRLLMPPKPPKQSSEVSQTKRHPLAVWMWGQ